MIFLIPLLLSFTPLYSTEIPTSTHVDVYVLHAQKGEHYYVIIKNTWDNGPDIIYHDPSCICGNGEMLAKEDLKRQTATIPINKKSLNSSEILDQQVQMMGMTLIQENH
jgi:hypothetical protein